MSNLHFQEEIERLEREREALLGTLSAEERAEYERVLQNFSITNHKTESKPDTEPST